jgi:hypothetical protein
MLEKIGLAIMIAVSLYSTTEVRPPQRVVTIETEVVAERPQSDPASVLIMI